MSSCKIQGTRKYSRKCYSKDNRNEGNAFLAAHMSAKQKYGE